MVIKNFTYKDKPREVLVCRETATHIEGFDVTYLPDDTVREAMRVKTKDIDFSQMTEEQAKEEYKKLKELHKTYRNFLKKNIT